MSFTPLPKDIGIVGLSKSAYEDLKVVIDSPIIEEYYAYNVNPATNISIFTGGGNVGVSGGIATLSTGALEPAASGERSQKIYPEL
jgi:hypothetical protein